MDPIETATKLYGIKPTKVMQKSDSLWKIDDGTQQYAFKKSFLDQKTLPMWKQVYQLGHEKKIPSILPVYLSRSSKLYGAIDDEIYYLSPWVQSSPLMMKDFYQALGTLHRKTKIEQEIQIKKFEKSFQQFETVCKSNLKKLLYYVETFEQRHYPSPLELQVCIHYRDLERCFQMLLKKLDEWSNRKAEASVQYPIYLCHGNLDPSHVLRENQTFFINWERATYDNCTKDLIHFLRHDKLQDERDKRSLIEHFQIYLEENKLTDDEITFLSIHLLNPLSYMRVLDECTENRFHRSMVDLTIRLEKQFYKLIFCMKFVEMLDQIIFDELFDDDPSLDPLQSESDENKNDDS